MTDMVFGPGLIQGDRTCPDCRAGPGIPCRDTCPRWCACRNTGWVTTTGPGDTVTQRPCRDCLGPPDPELPF